MSEIRNRNNNHPKSDEAENETTRIEQEEPVSFKTEYKEFKKDEEDEDCCWGFCCWTKYDIIGAGCYFLGCLFFPLWCCFFARCRKSKKDGIKFFAYLSCCGFIIYTVIFTYVVYIFLVSIKFYLTAYSNKYTQDDIFTFYQNYMNEVHEKGILEPYMKYSGLK